VGSSVAYHPFVRFDFCLRRFSANIVKRHSFEQCVPKLGVVAILFVDHVQVHTVVKQYRFIHGYQFTSIFLVKSRRSQRPTPHFHLISLNKTTLVAKNNNIDKTLLPHFIRR